MATMYKEVAFDIDMDSFSDGEILEEYENRGLGDYAGIEHLPFKPNLPQTFDLIVTIYKKRSMVQDYQSELDLLIYEAMGRIT